jgi:hypothetical protein
LSDRIIDLDKPVTVTWNDKKVFEDNVQRSLQSIEQSLQRRLDKEQAATAILELKL